MKKSELGDLIMNIFAIGMAIGMITNAWIDISWMKYYWVGSYLSLPFMLSYRQFKIKTWSIGKDELYPFWIFSMLWPILIPVLIWNIVETKKGN